MSDRWGVRNSVLDFGVGFALGIALKIGPAKEVVDRSARLAITKSFITQDHTRSVTSLILMPLTHAPKLLPPTYAPQTLAPPSARVLRAIGFPQRLHSLSTLSGQTVFKPTPTDGPNGHRGQRKGNQMKLGKKGILPAGLKITAFLGASIACAACMGPSGTSMEEQSSNTASSKVVLSKVSTTQVTEGENIYKDTSAENDKDVSCPKHGSEDSAPSERDLAEIDQAFMKKYNEMKDEEREILLKKLKRILRELRELSEDERKAKLRSFCPPLPSREVLQQILPPPSDANRSEVGGEAPKGPPSKEQLAEIDKRFLEKFNSVSDEEKRRILGAIKKIMDQAKSMTEEQRRKFFQSLKRPLPSKEVLEQLVAQYPPNPSN